MNFAEFAQKWAKAAPDAPAVALGTEIVWTYSEFGERISCLAGALKNRGLAAGDRVIILLPNIPEYILIQLAIWHAGLAAVPINARLHPNEVTYIAEQSGAQMAFVSPELKAGLNGFQGQLVEVASAEFADMLTADPLEPMSMEGSELAWLFYTSGTTGRPKGAMITHRNMLFCCHCYFTDIDPQSPWTSILHPAPFSHGSGLYGMAHLMKGSCQVFPRSRGFEPAEIFDLITSWPNCVFFAAPTMIKRLLDHPEEMSVENLKCIIFGGAPMMLEDIRAYLDRFGPRLAQLYGQGESPMTITGLSSRTFADSSHPEFEARIASAGLPQSGVEVRIVDQSGVPLGVGKIGEVICRSDCVIPGYWNDQKATEMALKDGWLWTGDMGSLDGHGYLTLSDRSKDMIISGGSNIYPREVEEVLTRHMAVEEVSVIGIPDRQWGEAVVAYIAVHEGTTIDPAELDQLCLDNIARFKRPRHYRFVSALPKNNYGKILKTRLREIEAGRSQE